MCEELANELRNRVIDSVIDQDFDAVLLSGGLDTSILTYIVAESKDFETISVGFEPSKKPDLEYVNKIVRDLDLVNHKIIFGVDEFERAIERTIGIEETFDPIEVRNSAAIFLALEKASDLGLDSVLTGDGSDEIFGGYSFLFDLDREEQRSKIDDIIETMRFSSEILGNSLGVRVIHPYTSDKIISFARDLDPRHLIRKKDGEVHGKWLLRRAFDNLDSDIIWRTKAPIEKGTGTEIFPQIIKISDEKFKETKRRIMEEDGIKIRNKQQLYCYRIYKEEFSVPKPENPNKRTCPYCKTNVPQNQSFCRTCGNGLKT